MRLFFCFVILSFTTLLYSDEPRLKPPEEEALASAEKLVKATYPKNLKSDATFWIDQATGTKDNSDARYVMLMMAYERAKVDLDIDSSIAAIKLMKKYYEMDFIDSAAMAEKALLGLPPKYALLEISDDLSDEKLVEIADEWWKLAESLKGKPQQAAKLRAVSLYKSALPKLSGLTEQTVRNKIEKSGLKNSSKTKVNSREVRITGFDPSKKNQGKSYVFLLKYNWPARRTSRMLILAFRDNGESFRSFQEKDGTFEAPQKGTWEEKEGKLIMHFGISGQNTYDLKLDDKGVVIAGENQDKEITMGGKLTKIEDYKSETDADNKGTQQKSEKNVAIPNIKANPQKKNVDTHDQKPRFDEVLTIAAKKELGYLVNEKIARGEKVALQYISGKWKGWGRFGTESPDAKQQEKQDRCRLAICEVTADNHTNVLAVVGPDTVTKRFEWVSDKAYEKLVLRMNDTDGDFESNPDSSVKYRLQIFAKE